MVAGDVVNGVAAAGVTINFTPAAVVRWHPSLPAAEFPPCIRGAGRILCDDRANIPDRAAGQSFFQGWHWYSADRSAP